MFSRKNFSVSIFGSNKNMNYKEFGGLIIDISQDKMANDYALVCKYCDVFRSKASNNFHFFALLDLSLNIATHLAALLYLQGLRKEDIFNNVIAGIDSAILSLKSDNGKGGNSWDENSLRYFHSYINKYLNSYIDLSNNSKGVINMKNTGMLFFDDLFSYYQISEPDYIDSKMILAGLFQETKFSVIEHLSKNSKVSMI